MPNYRRYYINNSMIFVTIVTNGRVPLLIHNVDLLKKSILETKYDFIIYAAVVLPDHLHFILYPKNIREFPKIISSIKYYFSRNVNYQKRNKTCSELKRQEKGVWQRRYYDHIIRDEDDLNKHLDYIHYNPVKHNLVTLAKDWKFSSFQKFVKLGFYEIDWCNFNDINKINKLELE